MRQKPRQLAIVMLLVLVVSIIIVSSLYFGVFEKTQPRDIPPLTQTPYEGSESNITWNATNYLPNGTEFVIDEQQTIEDQNHLEFEFVDEDGNAVILNIWILFGNHSTGGLVLAFVELKPAEDYEFRQLDAILTFQLPQEVPDEEREFVGLFHATPFSAWPAGTQTVYIDSHLSASLFDSKDRIFSYQYFLGDDMEIYAITKPADLHGGYQFLNIQHLAVGNYPDGQNYRAAIAYYFQTLKELSCEFSWTAKFQRFNLFPAELSSKISIHSIPQGSP